MHVAKHNLAEGRGPEDITPPAAAISRPVPAGDVILSFDVEEHFRIEAAAGLEIAGPLKDHYRERLESSTRWLLDQLDQHGAKATFFVVAELTRRHASLVKEIARKGHEIASHSWDHRCVHRLNSTTFREDLRRSKQALEQTTGQAVLGYRAPTFSIVRESAWALDVLAEEGFKYDSSIYPIWHDRYGVPGAPRGPFRARGVSQEILELPPATWRAMWMNIPTGGGGYFRLLPLFFMERAIRQMHKFAGPSAAMLFFHPWEFDREQERLALDWLNRMRTYVGISRTQNRLARLLARHRFARAIDVAARLGDNWQSLPRFNVNVSPTTLQESAAIPAMSTQLESP